MTSFGQQDSVQKIRANEVEPISFLDGLSLSWKATTTILGSIRIGSNGLVRLPEGMNSLYRRNNRVELIRIIWFILLERRNFYPSFALKAIAKQPDDVIINHLLLNYSSIGRLFVSLISMF